MVELGRSRASRARRIPVRLAAAPPEEAPITPAEVDDVFELERPFEARPTQIGTSPAAPSAPSSESVEAPPIAVVEADASVLVIDGAAPVPTTADWTVINYDILGRHVDELSRVPWGALVFDEAHYLKNHTSARSKLARQLTAAAVAAQPKLAVQLLTGTPLTSRPRDLFVLLQLVAHPLGRSFLSFAKRYCAAEKGEYGWKTGEPRTSRN